MAEKLTAGGEAAKYERPLFLLLAYTTHVPGLLMENLVQGQKSTMAANPGPLSRWLRQPVPY